jgi:hypothetical protein
MSIGIEHDRAGPLVDRLNAAIRENPLAAGLIGAGVAWMLFGGAKGFGKAAGFAGTAAGTARAAATDFGSSLADGLTQAGTSLGSGVRQAASDALSSAKSILPEGSVPDTNTVPAVSHIPSTRGDGIPAPAVTGRDYGAIIQSKLSEHLEQQPLLLGVLGLGLGAGIASTFASTKVEGEVMGEHGAAAREKMQDLADDVKERATQVISDVKEEAQRQGLTTDAATTVVKDVAEKAKIVAFAGRDSIKEKL